MPEPMTTEEASEKICPFMSYRGEGQRTCYADVCSCWGWVDGQMGQEKPTGEFFDNDGNTAWPSPEWVNKGHGVFRWANRGSRWSKMERIGERRGRCEAMSPNIEVAT